LTESCERTAKYQQAVKALLTLKAPAKARAPELSTREADLDAGTRVNYVVALHMLRSWTRSFPQVFF
jgi:hypothetical protein